MNRLNSHNGQLPYEAKIEVLRPRQPRFVASAPKPKQRRAPALLGLGGLLLFLALVTVIGFISNSAPVVTVHPTPSPQPTPEPSLSQHALNVQEQFLKLSDDEQAQIIMESDEREREQHPEYAPDYTDGAFPGDA
jgi:hypothetical protein